MAGVNRRNGLNVVENLWTIADCHLGKLLSMVRASGPWSFRVSRASGLMAPLFTYLMNYRVTTYH